MCRSIRGGSPATISFVGFRFGVPWAEIFTDEVWVEETVWGVGGWY